MADYFYIMRKSAGILLFRKKENYFEFFLVHPGGPFWKGKENGAWSIPKGEFGNEEDPLNTARREFEEETGKKINGDFISLDPVQQKGGKRVYAWAVEGNIDHESIVSNEFKQEWPYKSGKWQNFPEVDKAGWFEYETASRLINPAQTAFLDDLIEKLKQQ
jgi:predicted NUDIX family NTP pyrophosphohydrolase